MLPPILTGVLCVLCGRGIYEIGRALWPKLGVIKVVVAKSEFVVAAERNYLVTAMATPSFLDAYHAFGAVGEAEIAAAEQRLGVAFPDDYRWILSHCGGGLFRNLMIRGIGLSEEYSRHDVEAAPRRTNVPDRFVLIGTCHTLKTGWRGTDLAIDRVTGGAVYLRRKDDGSAIKPESAPGVLHEELLERVRWAEKNAVMPWDENNVRGWD